MSYEGVTQQICRVGHYSVSSVYCETELCECGEDYVWSNSVDETNGDSMGVVPEEDLNRLFGTGLSDFFGPIYRVPTDGETGPLRCYTEYDSHTGKIKYIPLSILVVHGI